MAQQKTVTHPRRQEVGYFASIVRAASSILEGMAVTFTAMRRPAITVQYPDRVPRPVQDVLPERSRGLLEVDVLCCTGCQACERACPIGVIRIRMGKEGKIRFLERFDIDLGKCMYCGFCVQACPVDAQAPGDREVTHSIRFTTEFEGVVHDYSALTYSFVRPGDRIVVAKSKKGQIHPTLPRGQRLREARLFAALSNPGRVAAGRARRARDPLAGLKPDLEAAFSLPVTAAAGKATESTAAKEKEG